ncbi:MAG: N-acetylmuramoyl-L-alanine amidase [Herpetosiphon sp.]
MRFCLLVLVLGLSAILVLPVMQPTVQSATPVAHPPVEQLVRPSDLATAPAPASTLADGTAISGPAEIHTSQISYAPQPFNYILLKWNAQLPVSATLEMEARVSPDGTSWSKWGHLEDSDDFLDVRDGVGTFFSGVVYAGDSHFWQLRVTTARAPSGEAPVLERVTVNTVDARDGRHTLRPSGVSPEGLGRPAFVSRWEWGGQEVADNSVPAAYYRADHLVVHHTADSTTLYPGEKSWADRVLAEWRFHTYPSGRGWGDVGYNWLIDPDGVIYEGRRGSSEMDRDSVGFHDTANYGSMGVVLLGTYDVVSPSGAMQDSLIRLLAWKSQQRHIDPYGSSFYYGCAHSTYCSPYHTGAVVANLAGHREVLIGHTSCPGDRAIDALPSIRKRVAAMLQPTPGTGNGNVIDEFDPGFTTVAGSWYDSTSGYDGHSYYTYATDGISSPSTNKASWAPRLAKDGMYQVEAHIPRDSTVKGRPTDNAHYVVKTGNGDQQTRIVSQAGSDEWIDVGSYFFRASSDGSGGNVALDDLTGEAFDPANRRPIFFDAIRWTNVTAAAQPQMELSGVTFSPAVVESGEVVRVAFTVTNKSSSAIATQDPPAGVVEDLSSGYVFDERECFLSNAAQSYPIQPKVTGRFRVMLGGTDGSQPLGDDCKGETAGYPWRWGFGDDLQPGQSRRIVGAVRLKNYTTTPRTVVLRAGLINENIGYVARDLAVGSITVKSEQSVPKVMLVNDQGTPLAQVYSAKVMPQSLLARTVNPISVIEDRLVGTIPWDGNDLNWGSGGPLGLANQFIVEQTRPFYAPVDGLYSFRLDCDDGAWLWVDGQLVVDDHGLHDDAPVTGSIRLTAGYHSLGFKYFQYYGLARAEYRWKAPSASDWSVIPVVGTKQLSPGKPLVFSADDLGGSGMKQLMYRVDDGPQRTWDISPAATAVVSLDSLSDASHTLHYWAVDNVGNVAPEQSLQFTVKATPPATSTTARVLPSGVVVLVWTSTPDAVSFAVDVQDVTGGQGIWSPLMTTTGFQATFFGVAGHSYAFRVSGTDALGNVEYPIPTTTLAVPPSASWRRTSFAALMR